MFVDDLSEFPAGFYQKPSNCLAVGWLDAVHPFPIGPTPIDFRQKLRWLCESPVRKTRGFHQCEFCTSAAARRETYGSGNGEIDVRGSVGGAFVVFVAPALITHYVDIHDYQPPNAFIDFVLMMEMRVKGFRECELSIQIATLARSDDRNARQSFYRLLLTSRVGTDIEQTGPVPPVNLTATTGNRLGLPKATLRDGTPALIVLSDIPQLAAREAASQFIEFSATDAIRHAVASGAGIIVRSLLPGREGMVIIPKRDVVRLYEGLRGARA